MDTYSAAGHSTTDTCPRCGAALTGGVRWSRVERVLRVRRPGPERPGGDAEAEPETPPASAAG
jgi:hypothetical protein